MAIYDPANLKMIAQGGEAEIYDIGEDKVLRVMRRPGAKTLAKEQILFPILNDHHIHVPQVYEYTEVSGRPAEVMQKISGITMIERLKQHPFKMKGEVKELALLHKSIFDLRADCAINSIEDIVHYFAEKPLLVDTRILNFVLSVFEELPHDSDLCHGDFHPGNILIQSGEYYIIDWAGAYRSNYLSDIAHTYLLMKRVPQIPGQSRAQHAILSFAGVYLARTYLKEVSRLKRFELSQFSKWTVVMAFVRVYCGLPSETGERIRYLQSCCELHKRGVEAASWYKRI